MPGTGVVSAPPWPGVTSLGLELPVLHGLHATTRATTMTATMNPTIAVVVFDAVDAASLSAMISSPRSGILLMGVWLGSKFISTLLSELRGYRRPFNPALTRGAM